MNMQSKIFFLLRGIAVMLITVFGTAMAKAVPKSCTVTQKTNGYTIEFKLPEFKFDTINNGILSFVMLNINDFGKSSDIGYPELPQLSFNIMLPSDQKPTVRILSTSSKDSVLEKKIYPVQMPWPKSKPSHERPFSYNISYYENSKFTSTSASYTVSEPFSIAGVKGVTVTVFPFSYNPSENKLTIIQKLKLSIDFPQTMGSKSIGKSNPFSDVYNSFFINSNVVSTASKADGNLNYLIITAPAFSTSMGDFVNYRRSKRYIVDLFTTEQTGSTRDQIKSFIQSRYDNLSTRPGYVLLVGDVDQIPAWPSEEVDNPWSDLYYGTVDGSDYFPDIYVGRFSVSTVTELTNVITKTIFTDKNLSSLDKKAVFLASEDRYETTENGHDTVIINYFEPAGFTNTLRYVHRTSATTEQVRADLNAGQMFTVFSGHGNAEAWADGPEFTVTLVKELTNTASYPFTYAFSCLTGSYNNTPECIGEAWIRGVNGATSSWASSVTSYWPEDSILEIGLFKAAFVDEIAGVSSSFNVGKLAVYNCYAGLGNTKRYFEQYNLFGDPALPIVIHWTNGSNVVYNSNTIQDATSGNGDGFINPGETINMRVALRNRGLDTAYTVNAVISSTSSYITFSNQNLQFGTINGRGQIATSLATCNFTVSSSCPTPSVIPMHLVITDTNGHQWTDNFELTVYISSLISGIVRSSETGLPLANARVAYSGVLNGNVLSGTDGRFSFAAINGQYRIVTTAADYFASDTISVTTPPGVPDLVINLGRPRIAVSPATFDEYLRSGTTKSSALTIQNSGHEDLTYSFRLREPAKNVTPAESLYSADYFRPLPKGTQSTLKGIPALKGSGGPDNFGNRWIDSYDTNGPVYTWEDIRSTGTTVPLDDDAQASINLSFPFLFYGAEYSRISIVSNGFITMGGTETNTTGVPLPSTSAPRSLIAAFWHDLNPSVGGSVFYRDFGNRFIIQFDSIPLYEAVEKRLTFQIVLEHSGLITFYYKETASGSREVTIGIQNADGNDGILVSHNDSTYLKNEMAVRFQSTPEWINLNALSGTVSLQSNSAVEIGFSAAGMLPGIYNSTLQLTHNSPVVQNPLTIPIRLTVTPGEVVILQPFLAGVSSIAGDRAGGLILQNTTIGSAASGLAAGSNYKLHLR